MLLAFHFCTQRPSPEMEVFQLPINICHPLLSLIKLKFNNWHYFIISSDNYYTPMGWCSIYIFFYMTFVVAQNNDMIYIVMSYAFCFYSLSRNNIILSKGFSLIFLHNSYGTPKICLSLVGANLVGNMRWHHTKTYVTFRWVHTELSRHFRKDHTERPCNLGGTVVLVLQNAGQ